MTACSNVKELVEKCDKYHLSIGNLAVICGINKSQMRQYVAGIRNPSSRTIAKINEQRFSGMGIGINLLYSVTVNQFHRPNLASLFCPTIVLRSVVYMICHLRRGYNDRGIFSIPHKHIRKQ